MKKTAVYLHGKGGSAEEAEHYRTFFPEYEVIGLDYKAQTPWEARAEFPRLAAPLCEESGSVILIANSIGAYFSMHALADLPIERAFLISPIVDMEKLILDMLARIGSTESALRALRQIRTPFGETLSWEYLSYARQHPPDWRVPTEILYGGRDAMTSRETIREFARRIGAGLTVMQNGEHWFHTEEQMAFLDAWLMRLNRSAAQRSTRKKADKQKTPASQ